MNKEKQDLSNNNKIQKRPVSILLVSLLGGVFLLFLLSSIFATDNPLFYTFLFLTIFTPIFFIISLVLLLINKRKNKRRTNYFIISTAVLAVLLIISPVITYLTKETLGEGTTAKGKIAFDSDRDENREIYIMNADGTEQTRLTNNPASDGAPSFSPDGSKIAFVSYRDGNWEIYIMNADGSGQVNLTNNPADDGVPSFSPDGSKIAFMSYRDGNFEIYIMNADGSEQTRLTDNPAYDWWPSFSP